MVDYLTILAWPVSVVVLCAILCHSVDSVCNSINTHSNMKVEQLKLDIKFIQDTELGKLHAFIRLAELEQLPSNTNCSITINTQEE